MTIPIELSMEQQFSLRAYQEQVKGLDQMQAQEMLLEVLRQLMVKENVIKHLLKQR
jgi:Phycobilisome degradation protein nblA